MSLAQIQTNVQVPQASNAPASVVLPTHGVTEVLTLRLVPRRQRKKAVRWAEDVVDNELLGKKKSKKCCIFHKQRAFGDWSDSEDEAEAGVEDCEDCQASS
eukprot:jgi/Botrbrau1/4100/Bobra.152_3s0048.1